MRKCSNCKNGSIDAIDIGIDGIDAMCKRCIDRKHVDFMHTMRSRGVKMGCVAGCRCGFGKSGRNN